MAGKANIEVRPTYVNKGEMAKRLVEQYGTNPPEFILCAGDDFTDEGKIFPRDIDHDGIVSTDQRGSVPSLQTCSALCTPSVYQGRTSTLSPSERARR